MNLTSQRLWITGILFSIVHSVAKSARITQEIRKLRDSGSVAEKEPNIQAERKVQIAALKKCVFNKSLLLLGGCIGTDVLWAAFLLRAYHSSRYQLVQDSLDIWLPATSLEFAHLNDGVLGIIG